MVLRDQAWYLKSSLAWNSMKHYNSTLPIIKSNFVFNGMNIQYHEQFEQVSIESEIVECRQVAFIAEDQEPLLTRKMMIQREKMHTCIIDNTWVLKFHLFAQSVRWLSLWVKHITKTLDGQICHDYFFIQVVAILSTIQVRKGEIK